MPIDDRIAEEEVIQKIKNIAQKPIATRKYDGTTIYSLSTNNGTKISVIGYKKILAFSYSTSLIEDAVRQLNAKTSLMEDANFAKMIVNSGQSEDGNLFVNWHYFAKVVHQYINKSNKKYAANLLNYSGWTELDIEINPNQLSFNGFSFPDDKDWITVFEDQKPQHTDVLSILPFNTAFFYHYGLSNSKQFFEKRKLTLKNTGQFFSFQQYLDEQTQKYNIDLEEELMSNIGKEVAFVVTESLTNDFSDNKFVVFQTNNVQKTSADLLNISKKVNSDTFDLTEFKNYTINRIGLKNVFNNLLGKPFVNLENHFYTIIDEYVVFGNSENGLKKFITNVVNERTLKNSDSFDAFTDNLSSISTLFIYNNIARSNKLYQQFAIEEHLPIYENKWDVFQKFEAISLQVSAEKNGLYYNNIHLKYNPSYKKETTSLWELVLDTVVFTAPQIVLNHNTKTKEIFVQDAAHKIYLISNTGKIVWSKQLKEPIMGKVHQIDVYKNNKLQLLFNTKSTLFLIDRNGNNVENYPIKLPSNASNELTPLDYAQHKDYRIFVGCENNMVYNYDVKGIPTKGWNYEAAQSPAKGKITHFSIAGKDYIVIPLKNGRVKVVQRNGKDRLVLKKKLAVSSNPIFLKVGSTIANTYLTTIDSVGNICKLSLNDQVSVILNDEEQPNAHFNIFNFDANNSLDYAITHQNTLKIIDAAKKVLYQNSFEAPITYAPQHFQLADKTHSVGVVTQHQVYLINANGLIAEGFPLPGATPFCIDDINNDNADNLVVVDGKVVYAYHLN